MRPVEVTGADMRDTDADAAAVVVRRIDRQACQRRSYSDSSRQARLAQLLPGRGPNRHCVNDDA